MGAGSVKNMSVPGFTLKTDMSGDVAKAKGPEAVATKAVGDGFEAPKAAAPEAMGARAAAVPNPIEVLRNLIQQAKAEVATWSPLNPAKYVVQGLLAVAEGLLNQADNLLRNGLPIPGPLGTAINWIIKKIREALGW